MLNQLFSFVGWAFLPNFATRRLLPVFHHFYRIVLRKNPPAPGTPLYAQHFRYTYAFAILSYLLYNFYTATASVAANYYEMLGVDPEAQEGALKAAFRQFARKNHPDRVGPQGVEKFIDVRDAFEALKNPVTRFAYDRFGPSALKWVDCKTPRDYLRYGLIESSGFYIITALVLLVWSAVGRPSPIAFWRYVLFALFLTYELTFILYSPPPPGSSLSDLLIPRIGIYPGIFTLLWPRRVAFQHIRLLHSMFVFASLALSRVAPVFFAPPPDMAVSAKIIEDELGKLTTLARAVDTEVLSQIQLELRAAEGPEADLSSFLEPAESARQRPTHELMAALTEEMEDMVIENRLKRDAGPLRSAVQAAVMRRHRSEPPPARTAPFGMLARSPSPSSSPPPPARSGMSVFGMPSPSPTPTPRITPPPAHAPSSELRRSTRIRKGSSSSGGSESYIRGRSMSY